MTWIFRLNGNYTFAEVTLFAGHVWLSTSVVVAAGIDVRSHTCLSLTNVGVMVGLCCIVYGVSMRIINLP